MSKKKFKFVDSRKFNKNKVQSDGPKGMKYSIFEDKKGEWYYSIKPYSRKHKVIEVNVDVQYAFKKVRKHNYNDEV